MAAKGAVPCIVSEARARIFCADAVAGMTLIRSLKARVQVTATTAGVRGGSMCRRQGQGRKLRAVLP